MEGQQQRRVTGDVSQQAVEERLVIEGANLASW